MKTFWDWIKGVAASKLDSQTDPPVLPGCEGLLVPDKPAVPGASRINMSLFPRSRLRANPHLWAARRQNARVQSWPSPGLPV